MPDFRKISDFRKMLDFRNKKSNLQTLRQTIAGEFQRVWGEGQEHHGEGKALEGTPIGPLRARALGLLKALEGP